MTLAEVLDMISAPSDQAWRALIRWLDELDEGALKGALPSIHRALQRWPGSLQRASGQRWAAEGRPELLTLCRAPGGLVLEVAGGGGGMAEALIKEIVSVDRLGEAALSSLERVFDVSGDCGSSAYATPFRHGQALGPAVDLRPHIVATYRAMSTSFRLNRIPQEVWASLRMHYRGWTRELRGGQTDVCSVPLDLAWDPQGLVWPMLEGARDWYSFDRVVVYRDEEVIYDDKSVAYRPYPSRDWWPDAPPASLLEAADDDDDENAPEASISRMLAMEGLDELLRAMLRLLVRFGVWAPSSFDDAYAQVLFEVEELADRERRAQRLCETLADYGRLGGAGLETVSGLLCCHTQDLGVFRAELRSLCQEDLLVLRSGGEIDALVPLYAWAVTAHANVDRARSALAEAILEHPHVDDLFCGDAALLRHMRG